MYRTSFLYTDFFVASFQEDLQGRDNTFVGQVYLTEVFANKLIVWTSSRHQKKAPMPTCPGRGAFLM